MGYLAALFSCLFTATASCPTNESRRGRFAGQFGFGALATHQVLCEVIPFLGVEDLENWAAANFLLPSDNLHRDYQEFSDCYEKRFSIRLRDGAEIPIMSVLAEQRVSDIRELDDLGFAIEYVLKATEFKAYASQGVLKAARENSEPYSLKFVIKLIGQKIAEFEAIQRQMLAKGDRHSLARHSYGMLYTSYGVWDAVWTAARGAAMQPAWDISGSLPSRVGPDSVWSLIWRAARDATELSALRVAWEATMLAAWGSALKPAWSSQVKAFWAARDNSGDQFEEIDLGEQRMLGRASYLDAELAVLYYLLGHFDAVLSSVYEAAVNQLTDFTDTNADIFTSRESWSKFKEHYFGDIIRNPDQCIYVNAWLLAIENGVRSLWSLSAADREPIRSG